MKIKFPTEMQANKSLKTDGKRRVCFCHELERLKTPKVRHLGKGAKSGSFLFSIMSKYPGSTLEVVRYGDTPTVAHIRLPLDEGEQFLVLPSLSLSSLIPMLRKTHGDLSHAHYSLPEPLDDLQAINR